MRANKFPYWVRKQLIAGISVGKSKVTLKDGRVFRLTKKN